MATLFLVSCFFFMTGAEELATPASLLGPKDFNYHPYEAEQYLKEVEPTKQGPVLFPNDAPPPPRPPLIVTSRPLLESIARSELNQDSRIPFNNSIASPSQLNHVSFKPEFRLKPEFRKLQNGFKPKFLARVKDYKPFVYPGSTAVPVDYVYPGVNFDAVRDNKYSDYEEHTALPPIYKAIADHAKKKVLKLQHKPQNLNYQTHHDNDDVHHDNSEYNQGSNYAFSYTVRDRKTGDDFSHSQHSSGSATNGEYRVRLPDGRMQIVSYTADENGYKADVRYDDEDKTAGNSVNNHIDYNHNDVNHNTYNHNDVNTYNHNNDITHNNYKHIDNDLGHENYKHNHNDYTHNDYNYNYNKDLYDHSPRTVNYNHNDYSNQPHNYVQDREYKPDFKPIKEDYNQYSDSSKEYYNNDYSLEYDGKNDNYEPHKRKFGVYDPKSTLGTIVVPSTTLKPKHFQIASTVKPSYDEIKHLFVNRNVQNTPQPFYNPSVEINVPSTTPTTFGETTEHVVLIGNKPKLYTNIRHGAVTQYPLLETSSFVTPRSYLVSTIASLKDKINSKPILSDHFINKINKYLSFN